MNRLKRLALVVLIAALLPIATAFSDDDGMSLLTTLLDPNAPKGGMDLEELLAPTAFMLGEAAIPPLEKALYLQDGKSAYFAARALAVVGGDHAVAVLQSRYEETKDPWVKTMLCFARGARGRPDDVKYLMDIIEGLHPRGEGDSLPIGAAAYALGVLKVEEARGHMQRIMKADADGYEGEGALRALQWMDRGVWQTPQAGAAIGEDEIILTLFRFGIPRTDEADDFLDKVSQRIWHRHDKSWSYRDCSGVTEKMPYIGFGVWKSPDGARALCSASLVFARLNAIGYDFLLQEVKGEWRIVGVMLTWIS